MNESIRILIFAESGLLADSLKAILASLPGVQVVDHTNLHQYTLALIQRSRPDAVLIECSHDGQFMHLIGSLRCEFPGLKIVAITENIKNSKLASGNGVDYVLLKGFSGREFQAILGEIQQQKLLKVVEECGN
jgi:DNA-binding NarL/FixJ family response regulator